MKKAILKPFRNETTGSKKIWLEDRNGAKYSVLNDANNRQHFYTALGRNSFLEVSLSKEGELKYSSRKLGKGDFTQYKDFPELKAVKTEGPDPDATNLKPNPVREFLQTAMDLKPETLEMTALQWKGLIHDVMEGENILMLGASGTGKTWAVRCIAEAFDGKRPFFSFNLGASQDPRTFLIGNTQFEKDKGTYFNRSAFVNAITTENAIILMDELSRAHPDAANILMTVLDDQRYLRIDEADNTPVIKVAKGVSFLATANIGNEYTATRVMDKALIERFELMIMEPLSKEKEINVLTRSYPDLDPKIINSIAEIAEVTRLAVKRDDNDGPSTIISTRSTKAMAKMCNNGFSLADAAELRIYPFYSEDGGADSERTYMRQLVQKYIVSEETKENTDEVFNTDGGLLNQKPWS